MTTVIVVSVIAGVLFGWYLHKLYLRFLYKQLQRIKRAMRGGQPKRRRRR
jgi:hypothetical protein